MQLHPAYVGAMLTSRCGRSGTGPPLAPLALGSWLLADDRRMCRTILVQCFVMGAAHAAEPSSRRLRGARLTCMKSVAVL